MNKQVIYFDAETSARFKERLQPVIDVLNVVGEKVMNYYPTVKWKEHPRKCVEIMHKNAFVGTYLQKKMAETFCGESGVFTIDPQGESRPFIALMIRGKVEAIAKFTCSGEYLLRAKYYDEVSCTEHLLAAGAILFKEGIAYAADNYSELIDEYCTNYEQSKAEHDFIESYKEYVLNINSALSSISEMMKKIPSAVEAIPVRRNLGLLFTAPASTEPLAIHRIIYEYFGKTRSIKENSIYKYRVPKYSAEEIYEYTGYKLENPSYQDWLDHPTLYDPVCPPSPRYALG